MNFSLYSSIEERNLIEPSDTEEYRSFCLIILQNYSQIKEILESEELTEENILEILDRLINLFVPCYQLPNSIPSILHEIIQCFNIFSSSSLICNKICIFLSKFIYHSKPSNLFISPEDIQVCIQSMISQSPQFIDNYLNIFINLIDSDQLNKSISFVDMTNLCYYLDSLIKTNQNMQITEIKTLFLHNFIIKVLLQTIQEDENVEITDEILQICLLIINIIKTVKTSAINSLFSAFSELIIKIPSLIELFHENEIIQNIISSFKNYETDETRSYALNFIFFCLLYDYQQNEEDCQTISFIPVEFILENIQNENNIEIKKESLKCFDLLCTISPTWAQFGIDNVIPFIITEYNNLPFSIQPFLISIIYHMINNIDSTLYQSIISSNIIEFIIENIDSSQDIEEVLASLEIILKLKLLSQEINDKSFDLHFSLESLESKYDHFAELDNDDILEKYEEIQSFYS